MSSCNEMKMGVCEGVCVRERESVLEYVWVFACKCVSPIKKQTKI